MGQPLWSGWVTGEALPPRGDLLRWRVHREGSEGEISLANPGARLRDPTGQRASLAAQVPTQPAVVAVEAGKVSGVVARVSAPLTPWDPAQRLSHSTALQVLGALGPAVVAAGDALGGELDVEDLVLGAGGALLLSPSGLVREDSLSRLPFHRAPEWTAGSSSGAAALYGLGAVVYRAVTGRAHLSAANRGQLDAARQTPVPTRQADPSAPSVLAETLDALVSPDPARRLAALATLAPAEPAVLPPPTRRLGSAPPAVVPTPSAKSAPLAQPPAARPSGSTRDLPLGEWVVLFDADRATGRAQRRLAALLDVEVTQVEADHPLVVAVGRTESEARAAAERLASATGELSVRRKPTGRVGSFGLLGVAGAVAVSALLLPKLAAAAALTTAVGLLVAAKGLHRRAAPAGVPRRVLAGRWAQLQGAVGAHPDDTEVARVLRRLQATRRALLAGDLNAAMRTDLLDAVESLDDEVRLLGPDAGAEDVAAVLRLLATLDTALADAGKGKLDPDGLRVLEGRVGAAASALRDTSA